MLIPPWAKLAAAAAAGFLLAWWIWHPRTAPVETEALQRDLPNGAIAVQRDPQAEAPKPVKAAAKALGGKLERAVSITVQPRPVQNSAEPIHVAPDVHTEQPAVTAPDHVPDAGKMACSCAPVTIDLGIVRMPDQTRRVVATAQGGVIVGGLDIPLESAVRTKSRTNWAAGVSYEPVNGSPGAWVDRSLGPFVVGVAVEARKREGLTATARVGIRW